MKTPGKQPKTVSKEPLGTKKSAFKTRRLIEASLLAAQLRNVIIGISESGVLTDIQETELGKVLWDLETGCKDRFRGLLPGAED